LSAVSEIKVAVPNAAQQVIDMAMQLHGGAGISDDLPLAAAWTVARALRIADGPDEVHRGVVARIELGPYKERAKRRAAAAGGSGE
jgi:acyl-CoA dehydrogenase